MKVRDVEAQWYVTFHQMGIVEGRERFLEMLDAYHDVIARRHGGMLEFLAEPHTIDDMATHRFVYRAHVDNTFAHAVERRTARLHVERMVARGEAVEVESGLFQVAR